MNETIHNETDQPNNEESKNKHRCKSHRCGHRHGLCGRFFFAILMIVGIVWAANAVFGHHHHHFWSDTTVSERQDRGAEYLADHVDTSEAQTKQIRDIVAAYAPNLQSMRTVHVGYRQQLTRLLGAAEIDRVELEQLRLNELAQMDTDSKEVLQMIVDIADIMTPEQRQHLMDEINTGLHRWH